MNKSEIKKKIRELKRREIDVRSEYGQRPTSSIVLVWDTFFGEKSGNDRKSMYDLDSLSQMTSLERKIVFEEFFFAVYVKHYREIGLPISNLFDPSLLQILGLHHGASMQDVKERFRILAHKYHPDKGGDIDVFRTLLEAYEKLKS